MPRVSVIIPTFNSAPFIKRAVRSVLAQTYKDFEVLIVDDGSADSTKREVEPFLSEKCVRFFQEVRRGPSSARNKGIDEAKGEYISFLDSDDVYFKDRIEHSVMALDVNIRADISYSNEIFFFEDNPRECAESPHPKFSGDIFFYLKRSNFIHTSTVTARRGLFDRFRFDENLENHEDWDLFLKVARQGGTFHYIPKILVRVSLRRGGLTNASLKWAESRKIVGERAKAYWKDLKKKDFLRYVKLKAKASFIDFPDNTRFNRKMPHDLLK